MRRWNIIAAAGMLIPPSLVIGCYMYLGLFNRMLSDDYCSMYQAQHLGLLRSIWFWYITWHGGFAASAADWFISLWGSKAFPFHTFVFLSAWLVFTVLAVRKGLHFRQYSSSGNFPAFFLAVFLVFATLSLSPDISQSLFWWGGVRGYLSPLVLVMLYFALYYHFLSLSLKRIQTVIWLCISFGLIFFIGGFSETFTPVLVAFLAVVAGIRWITAKFNTKDASFLFLSVGFLGALCSLIVVVAAPGNSARQSFYPAPSNLFTILQIALTGYFAFLYGIFSSPTLLTGLLGVTLGSVWLGMRASQTDRVAAPRGWWILVFFLAGFVLAFGCFPPAAYGMSETPPPRTLITPAFILVLGLLIAGFVLGEWLAGRWKDRFLLAPSLLLIACGLIIFSSWGTFQNLYSMRAEHVSFAQKWDRVDAQIREAKNSGLKVVNIPSMTNWAGAQYPTDNPKYYPNLCYSKFYDIQILAPARE